MRACSRIRSYRPIMTLFIVRSEHRDTQAIHAKLDEIRGPRTRSGTPLRLSMPDQFRSRLSGTPAFQEKRFANGELTQRYSRVEDFRRELRALGHVEGRLIDAWPSPRSARSGTYPS